MTPKFRTKRGLIDGLGTLIKTITGNMDANDAITLNKHIEKIFENEQNINEELDNQNQINKKMIERFDNITKHVNDQQENIVKYLRHFQDEIGNKVKSEEYTRRYVQLLNQIDYSINLLNDHINSISEAVILSKLNIISKHILSKNELSYIYDSFKEQNVKLISDEHVYEMLKLQAYYNNSNIVFNIQIPIVSKENYSLFHVIPLPTPNNKIIFTKPFLILNPMLIQYFDEKCLRIEGIFYHI